MATQTFSSTEHRQVALDFLTASDEEFARGDHLQGAEKLWGAAAHQSCWRHRNAVGDTIAIGR